MFASRILRRTSALVLITFTSLTMQPLQAAMQLPKNERAKPGTLTPDEKYSRLLADIHELLKQLAPASAMPAAIAGKQKNIRAVGPNMKVVVEETIQPMPGVNVTAKLKELRSKLKEVDDYSKAADASFAEVERHIKEYKLPAEILNRHEAAVKEYETRKTEFESLSQAVIDTDDAKTLPGALNALAAFFAKYPSEKAHNPVNPSNLPSRTASNKPRKPHESTKEFRASLFKERQVQLAGPIPWGLTLPSSNLPVTPTSEDLGQTDEVQITPPIQALADSLNNNPVTIYNWVRNNIEFIPTYGSIQGADVTLQTLRGNAFDTASLLIGLLRASKIPARYVYGTIEVPMDKAMNWVGGVTKPEAALNLLGQGGIPNIGVISGGTFKTVKLEHVWVEAWVDFVPSRGAVNKTGDTWVKMDASFKQYSTVPSLIPSDFAGDIQVAAKNYMQSATQSPDGASATGFDTTLLSGPIGTAQAKMAAILQSNPGKIALEEIIGGREIRISEPSILAGTLPYKIIATGGQFTAMPTMLQVTAQIDLYTADAGGGEGSVLFSQPILLSSLGYGSLNLTHAPATATDASIWDSYTNSGAQSFPAYLINVKSRLSLNGVLLAESQGVKAGQDLILKVSFGGAGQAQSATFRIIAGDEVEVGINGAGQVPLQGLALKDRTDLGTAANNLYVTGKTYWTQEDFQKKLLGQMYGVVAMRLPSVGIFASPLSVTYWYGLPKLGSYHSRQVDIKLSHIAAVALDNNAKTATTFAMHAGMLGSATEGTVIEQVFSKPIGLGANTLRLLALASEQKIPIYHLDSANMATYRSTLAHSPEVLFDIENAINAGLTVIIPQTKQTHGAWVGSGYIMADPVTGSADYRISGGLSGNVTDDACQRATKPIFVSVPDIAFIWWLLFGWMVDDDFNFNGAGVAVALVSILAIAAVIAIVAAPTIFAAGAAVATLSRATLTAVLLSMSDMAAADEPESCSCEPKGIPRRGGFSFYTETHNACADKYTDKEYLNQDVKLRDVAFDGLIKSKGPGTFYEIKTGGFYGTIKRLASTRPSINKFLEVLKAKAILGFYRERLESGFCGYEFEYGVKDLELMKDMQDYFGIHSPPEAARVFANGC